MNFLKKNLFLLLIVISISLAFYTFYRSEIVMDGIHRKSYFIFYFASLVLFLLSVISLFLNEKIKEYIIICLLSLIFSLYLFEVYYLFNETVLKNKSSIKEIYYKKTEKKRDDRIQIETYEDLKKINSNIAIKVPPSLYLNKNYSIFPLSGISNSQTIDCNDNGYYSIYKSDRYGFNNPDNEWTKKIEFFLIGDSFVHGSCVNRPDDISSVLRKLSKKSVLNVAYSDTGPLIQYAALREYLNLNVKNILWFYYEGNDLSDLKKEKKNNILNKYINNLNFTQNLKLIQNNINSIALETIEKEKDSERAKQEKDRNWLFEVRNEKEKLENNDFTILLINLIKIRNVRYLLSETINQQLKNDKSRTNFNPDLNPNLMEFKKIIKLARDLALKNNSNFYFIYLPEYNRYKYEYDEYDYNFIKNIISELNIPFIDIHVNIFEKNSNPLDFFSNERSHYNEDGYKKISNFVFKFIKD